MTAILGPTNTGKTHFAMDRFLAHDSGVIGFPLRLLARENYDRAVAARGKHSVALVTGEEKIIPPRATHFVCTVEAMPLGREPAFVAVDEVQLMADPDRGHTFTDRVMNLRGRRETMFIGAETVRPILRHLAPKAEVITRSRFSQLSWAGPKKITRLPPRSATVAFSAADVYELAETIRRRRGGAAVVLGALSPRTRNAQVGMYQAGEVDYLVATDAIGMGLNMNIDHVAFARMSKFDGHMKRRLSPAEIGQIAGRAGRHMNDGTFGTTDGLPPLEPEEIEAVEAHEFPAMKLAFWRNADLDMASVADLLASLTAAPPNEVLLPASAADDFRALQALAGDAEVLDRTQGRERVALLWDVCQIPDFRKLLSDAHVRLVRKVYKALSGPSGRIAEDWLAREIDRLNRSDGDIGALVGRISEIRTWTYISYRSDWLDDAGHWQQRSRDIEDKLSDALHERLTERFVDRRTAVLVKRLREAPDLLAAVRKDGEVLVEGVPVGRLEGFRFQTDPALRGEDARAVKAAARRALALEVTQRAATLADAPDSEFKLHDADDLRWRDVRIATLAPGGHLLKPAVSMTRSDIVPPEARDQVERRLQAWLASEVRRRFGMLADAANDSPPDGLTGPARGLLYQLGEAGGLLRRRDVVDLIRGLTKADRKVLREAGIRLGRESVFLKLVTHMATAKLGMLLWAVQTGQIAWPVPARRGRLKLSTEIPPDAPAAAWQACGFRCFRGRAIRADALERVATEAWRLAEQSGDAAGLGGGFAPTPSLLQAAGTDEEGLKPILATIGYRWQADAAGGAWVRKRRKSSGKPAGKAGARADGADGAAQAPKKGARRNGGRRNRRKQQKPGPNPCSPFAILKDLTSTPRADR